MHFPDFLYAEPQGQSWLQFGELALALVLSSLIGLEREFRAKSAGLRTHTLVGVAAALIMLVSKYGFGDTIVRYAVVLDPSRVAAQIGKGAVEKVVQMCTGRGYSVQELAVERSDGAAESEIRGIHLQLSGRRGVEALLVAIGDIKGVVTARLPSADHGKD